MLDSSRMLLLSLKLSKEIFVYTSFWMDNITLSRIVVFCLILPFCLFLIESASKRDYYSLLAIFGRQM